MSLVTLFQKFSNNLLISEVSTTAFPHLCLLISTVILVFFVLLKNFSIRVDSSLTFLALERVRLMLPPS